MTPGCSPCRSEPASGKSDLLFENLRLGKNAPAATRAGLLRSQTLESIGENESSLRIADYHTYFVGCDEWGFSVWAHNTSAFNKIVESVFKENTVARNEAWELLKAGDRDGFIKALERQGAKPEAIKDILDEIYVSDEIFKAVATKGELYPESWVKWREAPLSEAQLKSKLPFDPKLSTDPIFVVVDGDWNYLMNGNHRTMAARLDGKPIEVLKLTKKQYEALFGEEFKPGNYTSQPGIDPRKPSGTRKPN
ncbi:hypothetical protein FTUN_0052 [Frigoriglobus tundricola]|uniref:ParB/Sulfiredoxin domain-containing protein n=2 Tax=Frigoriglobus tundricola TaxID=2774151 RepID=A0A6M5YH10_9BACT|nr:hypothetical protein FTUN_0052 [Frigoriglobus tundricola]